MSIIGKSTYCPEYDNCKLLIKGTCPKSLLSMSGEDCDIVQQSLPFCNFCKRTIFPDQTHCPGCNRGIELATTTHPDSAEQAKKLRQQKMQYIKCFLGMHVRKPYHLMYGDSKRDGVYMLCVCCHNSGKMISEQRDLTAGMSREKIL